MDGDGNHQRPVSAPGRAVPESLQWSSDANRIAFWTVEAGDSGRPHTFRLCVADAVNARAAEVLYTPEPGLGGDRPFFSRTGNVVCAGVFGGEDGQGVQVGGLFARRFTRDKGLLKFPLAGGLESLLADRPAARGPLRWPELAPDGKMLAAISGRAEGDSYLVLADFATGEVTEVRDRKAVFAAWSPTQRRLAYLQPAEKGALDLHVWDLDEDRSAEVVGGLASEATFTWAPNGRAIAYANVEEYALVEEQPGGDWTKGRSQTQQGSRHRWPTWSPNGLAIVLELRPGNQRERLLQRDPLIYYVTGKKFFPGGTRPLFAPE